MLSIRLLNVPSKHRQPLVPIGLYSNIQPHCAKAVQESVRSTIKMETVIIIIYLCDFSRSSKKAGQNGKANE